MNTSTRATKVTFDEHQMWVQLDDGRTLGIPLAWYPRLLHGTHALREKITISASGLHWEELDEDISIAGLLAGRGDMTQTQNRAA
jgi:Protein of unknown function (DUF2442)